MENLETQPAESEKIGLGKRIEISVNGEFECWDIVRPGEFSSLDKKIPVDSPLIKLIWGLRAGDEIRGKIGTRKVIVKIREVYTPNNCM